jgi:hypothetical protein
MIGQQLLCRRRPVARGPSSVRRTQHEVKTHFLRQCARDFRSQKRNVVHLGALSPDSKQTGKRHHETCNDRPGRGAHRRRSARISAKWRRECGRRQFRCWRTRREERIDDRWRGRKQHNWNRHGRHRRNQQRRRQYFGWQKQRTEPVGQQLHQPAARNSNKSTLIRASIACRADRMFVPFSVEKSGTSSCRERADDPGRP